MWGAQEDARETAVRTDAVLGLLIDDGGLDRSVLDAPPSVLRRLVEEEARSAGLSEADTAATHPPSLNRK